jgi:ABC-type branched-subunit amino acid transport system substrate-binding protein
MGDFIFRNALVHREEVKALLDYAFKTLPGTLPEYKRFAILYPNNAYGVSMRDFFWDEVKARGGVIAGAEGYKPGETDFTKPVKKLVGLYYPEPRKDEWEALRREARSKNKKIRDRDLQLSPVIDFGALFIPDSYATATIIADHLPYFDVKNILLLGDSNWNDPQLLQRSPKNVQGAVFTDGFFVASSRTPVRVFVANYQSAFGAEPKRHAAYAYDTAQMLLQTLQDPKIRSRSTLQSALLNLANFSGVTGVASFSEDGEIQKPPLLLRVEGEKFAELEP